LIEDHIYMNIVEQGGLNMQFRWS